MPVFEYTGLTEAGKNVRGIRDAESSKVLRQILRKDGVYLTDARAAEAGAVVGEQKTGLSREVDIPAMLGFAGVSSQDLAIATRQLATLIGAGIPLVDALTALVEQVDQPRLKRILGVVKQKVNEGSSLADALKEHPRIFSELYVNMIRAGESSGALDVVLVRLADFTESQAQLRNKIIGAMLYPAIMVVVGFAIVGILFVVVIPKVTKIFDDMNVTLPWTTRILIGVSSFARDYWYVVLVAVPAVVFGVRRFVRTPRGRAWWDRTKLGAPIFGELIRMLSLSRFAKTLATLLASGVPLLTAMDIVKNIVSNTLLAAVMIVAMGGGVAFIVFSILMPIMQLNTFVPK